MKSSNNSPRKIHIAIVDTDLNSTQETFELIQEFGFKVSIFLIQEYILKDIQEAAPDLILFNHWFYDQGIDAYEICLRLRANPATQGIPIIFLDVPDDSSSRYKAFAARCSDYIIRPFSKQELLARINTQLVLQSSKRTIEYLEHQVYQQTAEIEATHQRLTSAITERLKVEQALEAERVQLSHHVFYDELTQLANRKLLMERIDQALQRIKTHPSSQSAVLFIDLDRFKVVNDSLGHDAGDCLLITVAQHLKSIVRSTDTVARFGGDEFVLLLDPIQQPKDAIRCAERIIRSMRSPLYIKDQEFILTPSIGIAIGTPEYQQSADLLRDADIAMSRAKSSGRARHAIFNREMHTETLMQHQLERDLRQAIDQQQLYIHFQPTVCLLPNRLTGFEALVRWDHPTKGTVSPTDFIPLAEETGLIVPLGEWVMQATCQQIMDWQTKVTLPDDFRVSVNISIKQLQDPSFLKKINRILKQTGISGKRLRLELTESVFMDSPQSFIPLLKKLKEKGIELSIDDFGTGYSSLSYLHQLPVNYLKIDRSFVSSLGSREEDLAIVNMIVTLARQSGLGAIAEGVETSQQLEYLKALGCDAAQGYLFAKPLPKELAEELVSLAFDQEVSTPWTYLWKSSESSLLSDVA